MFFGRKKVLIILFCKYSMFKKKKKQVKKNVFEIWNILEIVYEKKIFFLGLILNLSFGILQIQVSQEI